MEGMEKIKLRIPPGVEDGNQLRSAGQGEAGIRGGASGDLYVVLHVGKHEMFERNGTQLFCEVPVGFKWFTPGLFDGSLCFGGEESAGASFLRRNGSVWSTDKDGLILCLLAAEITAVTGNDPGRHHQRLVEACGASWYTRIDAPASPSEKATLSKLSPEAVKADSLAGEPITARLTRAPGNDAPIGGLKVTTANGWFAARPSGTENLYKIYAESFVGEAHLDRLVGEAKQLVGQALGQGG